VVFIGEAPGKKEDETGRPFIGASGNFLTELIESAGLKRSDVFITSIVKYRPPNNRDPRPEEKAQSWPYLLRQLRVIQPKLVVTLGRHSMSQFVPKGTIGQLHGTLIEGGEWPVLPLFHPAAALYGKAMRATLFQDFAQLKKVLERKY
ncbi:MAG TPA: uracil-DNA glycosylase, partial [Magnetospirillaceae bacterium]|nr:uracil-DNA glycosylase [Magnetospirillaceae bacterium]